MKMWRERERETHFYLTIRMFHHRICVDQINYFGVLQLTFGNYIAVDEAVKYTPHPDDPTKTLLTQEAVVTVRGVPLTNYMEDLLASKISFNASKVSDFLLKSLVRICNLSKNSTKSNIAMNYYFYKLFLFTLPTI